MDRQSRMAGVNEVWDRVGDIKVNRYKVLKNGRMCVGQGEKGQNIAAGVIAGFRIEVSSNI